MEIRNVKKEFFILLVESDDDIREYLKNILKDSHFNLIEAKNLDEAFEAVRNINLHLVIADYYLGFDKIDDLITLVKSDDYNIPIVVISEAAEAKRDLLDKGVNFFLSKPFRSWELRSIIDNLRRDLMWSGSLLIDSVLLNLSGP